MQADNSSKFNVSKTVQPEPRKPEEKSKKGKQETRKKIIIEEMDAEGRGCRYVSVYTDSKVVLTCEVGLCNSCYILGS